MSILAHVRFTPFVGLPVIIDGNVETGRDGIGNVTFTWRDPLAGGPARRQTVEMLADILSQSVMQLKNRAGLLLVVTDPGGSLCQVAWHEVDPWAGTLLAEQSVTGVVALGSARASVEGDGLSLIVYRATHVFERGTNRVTAVSI